MNLPKRVLVACEESQATTIRLRAMGIEAFSADIQDCSGGHPEWHLKGDVLEHLNEGWDMIIAHPPCTYLTNSGVCWLTGKKAKEGRWDQMRDGAEFFKKIMEADCPLIAIENPIMHKHAVKIIGRKHDQLVQPFHFGHTERKATCFWLKGLPPLKHTNNVKEEMDKLPKSESQRLHHLPPSPERAKLRSKTFGGIADAMANQWGGVLLNS
jgi:hypothetical protein